MSPENIHRTYTFCYSVDVFLSRCEIQYIAFACKVLKRVRIRIYSSRYYSKRMQVRIQSQRVYLEMDRFPLSMCLLNTADFVFGYGLKLVTHCFPTPQNQRGKRTILQSLSSSHSIAKVRNAFKNL